MQLGGRHVTTYRFAVIDQDGGMPWFLNGGQDPSRWRSHRRGENASRIPGETRAVFLRAMIGCLQIEFYSVRQLRRVFITRVNMNCHLSCVRSTCRSYECQKLDALSIAVGHHPPLRQSDLAYNAPTVSMKRVVGFPRSVSHMYTHTHTYIGAFKLRHASKLRVENRGFDVIER